MWCVVSGGELSAVVVGGRGGVLCVCGGFAGWFCVTALVLGQWYCAFLKLSFQVYISLCWVYYIGCYG